VAEAPDSGGQSWILTGSLENLRINVERGFDVIGLKEGRRRLAERMEPGDEVFFYVTGVQAFGAVATIRSTMFEDRTPIWPRGRKDEEYPWRVEAEPVLALSEERFVPAEQLAGELEHVRKWPPEHWHLAFQGQLREISDADAQVVRSRVEAAAGVATT
jgi:hypothetical protein